MSAVLTDKQKAALARTLVDGIRAGDLDIVKGCMARGADPAICVIPADWSSAVPAFHVLMYSFNEEIGEEICRHLTSVDIRNPDSGVTALGVAIRQDNTKAVDFLMRHGADPLAEDKHGNVTLDLAREKKKIQKILMGNYPKREPGGQNDNAPVADPMALDQDLKISKPVKFAPKKKPDGLHL